MAYSVIFFDLDNTLLDFSYAEAKAVKKLMANHGVYCGKAKIKLYSAINQDYWERFERGEIKKEDIFAGRFETFTEKIGVSLDADMLAAEYFPLLAEGHRTVKGAKRILKYLKSRGISVYITTNGVARTQYRRLKDSGIDRLVNGIFVSETVGCQKPEKEYFEYCLKSAGISNKSSVLVIGDSASSDIAGGINAGLDTCLYNSNGKKPKGMANYKITKLKQLKKLL